MMWWWQQKETGLNDSSFPSRSPLLWGLPGALLMLKDSTVFPLTWSYVQPCENWALSLICSSLNIRWVMAREKKEKGISLPHHLTAQKPVAKFKSRKQLLDDLHWQDPKRKRQTIGKKNICLNMIQRFFFPPALFPSSNLGPGSPHNYKGYAT